MPAADPHDRPQPDGSDLRTIQPGDLPELSVALARAFEGNPGMGWTFRSDARRRGRLERGFELYLQRIWMPRGDPFTTEQLAGAACWLPPGGWHLPMAQQLRLLPGIASRAREDTPRLLRFFQIADAKHPREPHWYLALLGVDPDHQGRGFGSHLMRPVLTRCDREKLPAYLETDTERNVAFYERHGFAVTEKFDLPGGGPPIWLMWREPSSR